ncbi:phosphotransferase enzyme family protein [Dothidotthia symphoricarpi CBS 119687]|uniref:Phosphotransferase enzyme family protein n=1 Tax=Dothidotthia symphoricarpi CBS 119687 TaxID=1392245 RepID=A0A6A6AQR7_9PLEO|nr:phosphotransferase enzyme family protein [Dothidotthia symphoricarpi CBS 119687]KAF2133876.1 phosphotransferase enzyme family protein [Dothidotthia symphoricarpi CBS 119687]
MKGIYRSVLSGHVSASLSGRSYLSTSTSVLNRFTVQLIPNGRHWSSQADATVRDLRHDLDALNQFTSGRWLWGEREQLAARYIKFDLQKLCQLATSSVGSDSCAKVMKISEGQYNKVLSLTTDDGIEVIAKLPNPNAGRPHFTTASEVATMNFLRSADLPIPKIYAWNSRLVDNPVGAEYIIMEKQPGIMLDDVWDGMEGSQKAQTLKQVIEIEKKLASIKFTKIGSLYYKQDLPQSDSTTPLYIDGDGNTVHSAEFEIGPTNHRSFFDFGKGVLDIDRGPWSTLEEYVAAVAYREIACAEKGLKYPRMPEGLFYGPRQYQPRTSTKMSALTNYLKVAADVLPEEEVTHAAVLWHGDLHAQNIFVDPENPARIIGIIDWQTTSASPLFLQVTRPGFLDFNGPIPGDLGKVSLPENFDTLPPDEQHKAKALQQAQTLHNLYMALCYQQNPQVFLAMQQKDSLRHQVTVVPGTVLMDYEPYLNHLLRDVEKEWPKIVGEGSDGHPLKPCPLHFSAAEVEQQEKDEELWAQGVELMDDFIANVGGFKHWDGRVSNEDYETIREQLASGIEQFLDREARSAEERDAWLKALPFVDHE